MTQREVGDEVGVSQPMISQIENGERPVPRAIPEDSEDDRVLDREQLDSVLTWDAGRDTRPVQYVLAQLPDDGDLRLVEPVAAFSRAPVADAAAFLLAESGVGDVFAAPAHATFVEEQGARVLGSVREAVAYFMPLLGDG